jgi:hypothetical protein
LKLVIQTTMTHFFTIRINRTRACAMLLVWMFALMSGVANACLLESPGAAHASAAIQFTKHDQKHVNLAGHIHTEAGSSDAEDAHTSKQPCLKLCDDNSKSLPKKSAISQIDPGSAPINAELWSSADSKRLQFKLPIISKHAASLLPLRVLYARLAL